jgi:threonine synthase
VAAIGHSLGGRLVLASSADFGIGISPALDIKYSAKTEEALRNLRKHKVRYETKGEFLEIMTQIPVWKPCFSRPTLVIYGSHDISEIISLCRKLQAETTVVEVEGAFHNDSYLHEVTFAEITKYLQQCL